MTFDSARNVITVDPDSNFIADSGALFISELKADAGRANAPMPLKKDWGVIEAWLQCEGRPLKQGDYEKIGKAWRAYIARGVAPSAQLNSVFLDYSIQAARDGVSTAQDRPPSEVMDVFDRLLATDEDIARKRKQDYNASQTASNTLGTANVEEYHVDLIHISSAAELLKVEHPHFGKIQKLGFLKATTGLLTGTSRKVGAIEDYSSGKCQSVALQIEADNFMVTIASSFVLVTLKEGTSRFPVIQKKWKLLTQDKGEGITEFFGTVNTYVDSDGLRWEHRFKRTTDEDELVGFDRNGKEILIITLETIR